MKAAAYLLAGRGSGKTGPYLLMLLVLIAGCAGENPPIVQGKTADGLTVLQFAPEKETLRDEESTNLLMRIQNTGDALAGTIKAKIIRAGDLKTGQITTNIEDLEPPDEGFNQPGGIKEVLWTITTPKTSVPKTQEITARVEFNYQSETTREILVFSSAGAREKYQAGATLPAGIETNSLAPIRLQVLSENPIELGEGESKNKFTFKVYVTNEGSGVVETDKASLPRACSSERLDCIDSVEISSSTKDKIDCEGTTADASAVFKIPGVKLWQGKEATITCKLDADLGDKREKQIVIKALANYRYHYDAKTTVMIEPKR